ncbi:hypothetical protein SUDANB15_00742 [Streptomyces sp. enrichment culture]
MTGTAPAAASCRGRRRPVPREGPAVAPRRAGRGRWPRTGGGRGCPAVLAVPGGVGPGGLRPQRRAGGAEGFEQPSGDQGLPRGAGGLGAALALRAVPEATGAGGAPAVGTPAGEGGGGKAVEVEAGVFDEVDAALVLRPGAADRAGAAPGGLPRARGAPHRRSDRGDRRARGPRGAEGLFGPRAATTRAPEELTDRLRVCADGAARATGTTAEVERATVRYEHFRDGGRLLTGPRGARRRDRGPGVHGGGRAAPPRAAAGGPGAASRGACGPRPGPAGVRPTGPPGRRGRPGGRSRRRAGARRRGGRRCAGGSARG